MEIDGENLHPEWPGFLIQLAHPVFLAMRTMFVRCSKNLPAGGFNIIKVVEPIPGKLVFYAINKKENVV
jgi:hypothetical protein